MADMSRPIRGTAFTLGFSLYTATGVILNPGTYTARVAKDGGASAAATNSVTEEDTSYGLLSLVLSATEMTADRVDVYVKDDTSGCIAFRATIYPAAAAEPTAAGVASAVRTELGTELGRIDAAVTSRAAATDLTTVDGIVGAIKAKTDTIGSGVVTVVSPVSADGTWGPLVAGDDYIAGTESELAVNVSGLDLSGATIVCNIGAAVSGLACTAVADGDDFIVTVDAFTAAESALLNPGTHTREFEATWAGRKQTFGRSEVEVQADAT